MLRFHDFFTEMCLMEETSSGSGAKSIYNGRKLRRICLVLDCLTPNDFTNRTQNLVNLQHHVIREKKLSEREALSIFYNVVCVVNNLHEKNVIHRDLKLGNIVLNCRYVLSFFFFCKNFIFNEFFFQFQITKSYIDEFLSW